ncbi:1-phosphofructokinase [Acinetobacter baumannii]|uniref:Phosphofructokinase n=1 Tax=Acinetobacter baumannii (strain 1295743) TaxID=1310613 RepID=A0A009HK75_ACIB9|nr:1-phosphofructokinase [Acinetobacter baumannii]EXB04517.1 1-phosphofructokinase [Acinetobacter baumannii 1295743]MCZ3062998.1 1-phosphofructokinase [Acinetobacter baumannii]MDC4446462.1 1-phosphofructokinase [Acinetobacter baumannii]MDC4516958.1 1-phosphofructokinase [Acinetobacter baumannii]MDC4577347.1 1-phosphofructokinase [Acinetobacter baumannii]
MAKILTITLNPAIDVTIQLNELLVGEVNRQESVEIHAAGKGLNVAQVLKDLGHDVIVTGFLGEHNRQIFDTHFAQAQFQPEFIYIDGETRQNIKIAEHSGRMTDLNGKGFFVSETNKQSLFNKIEALLPQVEVVAIAGSLPQGFSIDELQQLIQLIKKNNKKVALDTSGKALVAAIECQPWMIKPNTDELVESYQRPATSYAEQRKLFDSLTNIEHVVISMGEDGVNWLHATHPLHAQAPKVIVKSTVGAGDSLLAGMIHGLVNQLPPEETLKTATAIASHAVTQIGFRIPTSEVLNQLKVQTIINSLSESDANR